MNIRAVTTSKAPQPIGPYRQAVSCGDMLFISGQIPLDPQSGKIIGVTIEEQARQALANVIAIAASPGQGMYTIVKTTVYLSDINHFQAFNTVYESMFGAVCPARSVVAVAGLPRDVLIEVEAVACR